MKYMTKIMTTLLMILAFNSAYGLTANSTYTISIQTVNSDGSLSGDLGIATEGVADANGKLTFNLSGVPDNSSCNFLVATVALKHAGEAIETKSVMPCPNENEALQLGVSDITDRQADGLIKAFEVYGSDDPVAAIFSYIILRTEGITTNEAEYFANNVLKQSIHEDTTNSFYHYLTNARNITAGTITAFTQEVVKKLANTQTGYAKIVKESVDDATDGDINSVAAMKKRGKAAAQLFSVLVKSARDAGFNPSYILEAFESMSSIAEPAIITGNDDGDLDTETVKAVNSSIGGGITKLVAERGLNKYLQALETLGATGADLTQYETAANALIGSMTAAFAKFDQVFTGDEDEDAINSANQAYHQTMEAAFDAFTAATAASDERITAMINNIEGALNMQGQTGLTKNDFQFKTEDGSTQNWPIMMVILTDYASNIKTNGGAFTYTRDDTPIPTSLGTSWGYCTIGEPNTITNEQCQAVKDGAGGGLIMNANTNTGTGGGGGMLIGEPTGGQKAICRLSAYDNDQSSCAGNHDFGGLIGTKSLKWTAGRSDATLPQPYNTLFNLQDDAMILDFTRFEVINTTSATVRRDGEKAHFDALESMAGSVTARVGMETNKTMKERRAIVTLMQSPDF
jgi:hypothetical protein